MIFFVILGIMVAMILIPVVIIATAIIIKELLKCWWRSTEEWRERKWNKKQ